MFVKWDILLKIYAVNVFNMDYWINIRINASYCSASIFKSNSF